MKQFLLPLAAFVVVGCSSMKPNARTNYVPPSTSKIGMHITNAQEQAGKTSAAIAAAAAKAKTAKERIKVIEKAVEGQPPVLALAQQLEEDIDELTAILLDAQSTSGLLLDQLHAAQAAKDELQQEVNGQTILLNTANRERNEAITQGAIDKRNAHRFKWIIIGLAVAAAGLAVFAFAGVAAFAPPLLYLTIGAPAAVGTFLFFYLGSGG